MMHSNVVIKKVILHPSLFMFKISCFSFYLCFKFVYNLIVTLCLTWMPDSSFVDSELTPSSNYWQTPPNLKKLADISTSQFISTPLPKPTYFNVFLFFTPPFPPATISRPPIHYLSESMSCQVPVAARINSKRYLGDLLLLFWKKSKVSCTSVFPVGF